MAWTNVAFGAGFRAFDATRDALRVQQTGEWVETPPLRVGSSTGTVATPHRLTAWQRYAISAPIPTALRPAMSARGPLATAWTRGSATVTGYVELDTDGVLYLVPAATVSLTETGHISVPGLRWLAA